MASTTLDAYWSGLDVKHKMENSGPRPSMKEKMVRIFADSRGARIDRELRRFNPDGIDIKVIYKRGAGLKKLWELAEPNLIREYQPDIAIFLGGVCDLTDRIYTTSGEAKFWPPAEIHGRILSIASIMEEMANNFSLIQRNGKMCFIPEVGLDLLKYNKVIHPAPWSFLAIQQRMERELRWLQDFTFDINSKMGMNTPRTLEVTHSKRHGRFVPVYGRLLDGLHPTNTVAHQLANTIIRYSQQG